ncbi:glucosaminidase domain-containing protein [Neobacillus ginsengisoli]|uniref:Flagellum-specific peptidoglycan hydrolase FlgJ n=1 Tax=Neobacillus ginsengisoli TaxID=904295 RepID=A0ABT9XVZ4_9BACI|nr:glucosaminidase domain-containing protein [Neobacillus ginsengisoli]MDQ0199558.1 flagellum-specific peptidoglycan hydrolase FlgJ [Neobacillus ginsengisoli]
MITGDNWFTKTMLVNTLSKNENLQSQQGITPSKGSNPFAEVLNQLLMQLESQMAEDTSTDTLDPNIDLGNNSSLSGQSMDINDPLSFQSMNLNQINPLIGNSNQNLLIKSGKPLSYQSINPDKIDQVLNGKLKGMGKTFVQAGQQFNIDPALLAAIAQHETGNGQSNAARQKNNIAGMMGVNGLKSYSSIEQSIMDMAHNISKNYLGSGLHTISMIGSKYAPIGAENDPIGLNNHWVTGVTKYFDQLRV